MRDALQGTRKLIVFLAGIGATILGAALGWIDGGVFRDLIVACSLIYSGANVANFYANTRTNGRSAKKVSPT